MDDDQIKKLIDKAWNKLYLLFTQNKELVDRLDSWVEANSGAWSIGWDHKRGSTELYAIKSSVRSRKYDPGFGVPFTEDSTMDDLQNFVNQLILQEVHDR